MAGGAGQNICPTCGTNNPIGAGFCRSCGTPLPQALEQRESLSSTENTPPPAAPSPPGGGSRLSRLAEARRKKEQSQPQSQSGGNDWLSSLRSDAAAVPLPVNDEDDEAPIMEEFVDTSRPAASSSAYGLEGNPSAPFDGSQTQDVPDFRSRLGAADSSPTSDDFLSRLRQEEPASSGEDDFFANLRSQEPAQDDFFANLRAEESSAQEEDDFLARLRGESAPAQDGDDYLSRLRGESSSDESDDFLSRLRGDTASGQGEDDFLVRLRGEEKSASSDENDFFASLRAEESSAQSEDDFLARLRGEESSSDGATTFDLNFDLAPQDETPASNPPAFGGARSRTQQTGPLFADGAFLDESQEEGEVPLFDSTEVFNPPPPPVQPETETDFDPRRGATGFLPTWLRELDPNNPGGGSSAQSSPASDEPAGPFKLGTDELGLKPFAPAEPSFSSKTTPADDTANVPDWLRDVSAGAPATPDKSVDDTPEWLKDLESQNTTKPQIEGDLPAWLRDISATNSPKAPSRPTFGDDEVAATLNFAFGDDATPRDPYDNDELPPFEVKPGTLPPEALRTGLTGELGDLPPLPSGIEIPSYLEDTKEEPASAIPPLPALDNLFVEETAQGEEVPFDLPPLPAFDGVSLEDEQAEPGYTALWGSGLAPWLRGLEPPSVEVPGELPPLDFPVIGIPAESAEFERFEEEKLPAATFTPPADEDVAALFEEPPSITDQELLSTSRTDGSTRYKETRPFSLRDVLRQTDSLAGGMDFVEAAEQREKERREAENADYEPQYSEPSFNRDPAPFSMSDLQSLPPDTSQELGSEAEPEAIPDWLRNHVAEQAAFTAPDRFQTSDQKTSPEATEAVPDWLQAETVAPSLETEAAEAVPDWLNSQTGAETAEQGQQEAVPDWLTGSQAQATPPSSESEEEIPDWLRTHPNMAAELGTPPTRPVPNWLEAQNEQESETIPFAIPDLPPESEPGLPDFELPTFDLGEPATAVEPMSSQTGNAPATPLFVPPLPSFGDEEEEEPGELKPFELSPSDEAAIPVKPTTSLLGGGTINIGEPEEEELPDWLRADTGNMEDSVPKPDKMAGSTSPLASAPPPAQADEATPSWLQELGAQQAQPSQASAEEPPAPSWLQELQAEKAKGEEAAAASDEEMPSWLQGLVSGEAPAQPVANKPEARYSSMFAGISRAEDEQADLPDWLKDSTGAATPAPHQEIGVPSEEVEVDRLLQNFATEAPAVENAPAGMPDWLREKPAAEPQFELSEDLPDWLKEDAAAAEATPELDLPLRTDRYNPETYGAPPEGVTVNGDQSKAPTGAETQPVSIADFLSDVDAPSWLRGQEASPPPTLDQSSTLPLPPIPGTGGGTMPPDFGGGAGAAPSALPGWLRAVGPTVAEQEGSAAPVSGNYGAAVGVLPQVDLPPRLASADVLMALVGGAGAAGAVATAASSPAQLEVVPGRKRLNATTPALVRYVLYALLIGVTLFALFQPLVAPPLALTTPVRGFYDTLNGLKPGDKVLIAYDWEADRSGEMLPMAEAVTQQVMKHRARIVTVSLNPQGPALASQITNEVATTPEYGNNATGLYNYGNGYINLGWRPGSEVALRSLFSDMGNLSDYRAGQKASAYPVMQGINSLNDFNAVVVLSGDESNVRTWIEQFGIQPAARLVFGTTAAVAPMARPYLILPPSAQANVSSNYPRAQGLIDGLNGTSQYLQLLKGDGIKTDSKLNIDERLTAQSFVIILLVLAVVVANVVYLIRKE
jgi:hypothetical protein